MMQAYQEAFATLQKVRTGGKQTVVVQHVQIGEGGLGWGFLEGAAVRSKDEERDSLSSACDAKRALPTPRWKEHRTAHTRRHRANSPSSHETRVVLQGGQGREATYSRASEGMQRSPCGFEETT